MSTEDATVQSWIHSYNAELKRGGCTDNTVVALVNASIEAVVVARDSDAAEVTMAAHESLALENVISALLRPMAADANHG